MSKKVLVGMSGGIDSSAAASLLQNEGFQPVGVTFVVAPYSDTTLFQAEAQKAKLVCKKLGIDHITLEIDDFEEEVVAPFADAYLQGETPNPCIICNRRIKFRYLYKEAQKRNIENIATGHYARVKYDSNHKRYQLLKGLDQSKDQSYFLWKLSQKYLSKIIFPLGQRKKSKIAKYVDTKGLIERKTGESQDICFIPGNDYRQFLAEYKPEFIDNFQKGQIIDPDGDVLGTHSGFYNFTIGQRKGFHVDRPGKQYVKSIDPKNNQITVTGNQDLFSKQMVIKDCNWISIDEQEEIEGLLKPRYRSKGALCRATKIGENQYRIEFEKKQRALTPGQSAVLYQDDKVIFGGIITKN